MIHALPLLWHGLPPTGKSTVRWQVCSGIPGRHPPESMVLPARIPLDACHQFRSEVAGFLRNSAQVTRQAWTGISGRFGLEYSTRSAEVPKPTRSTPHVFPGSPQRICNSFEEISSKKDSSSIQKFLYNNISYALRSLSMLATLPRAFLSVVTRSPPQQAQNLRREKRNEVKDGKGN